MKFCLMIFVATSASLLDAQTLEEAGPELNLEYYSNLAYDDDEVNSGDHTFDANLFEGDIDGVLIDEANQIADNAPKNRNAIISDFQKWPGGVMPYVYYNGYSEQQKAVIARAIVRLQEATCMKMVPRTSESNYIYIYPKGGCSSFVGRQGNGYQIVSLTNGCFSVGTVLHEFMHAAGFHHEQSRADRDSYVQVYWQNIQKGTEYNFNKYTLNEITHLKAPYDTCSIMHYSSYAFSSNGQATIVKIQPGGCELGQKNDFSDMDIRKLNTLYQCTGYPQVGCADQYSSCQAWANTYNYCSVDYVEFMMKNCCESCRKANCKDDNSNCDYWASSGFCKGSYEVYMAENCKKSCGTC